MGSWGYGPFDNDTAGELVDRMSRDVKRAVKAKTDSTARRRYEAARAAAQVMLLTHGPSIELALRALARMRSDTKWLANAREPKRLARELEKELSAVLTRMRTCKGCRKRYKKPKNDFKELVEIVTLATCVKVPKSAFGLRRKTLRRKKSKKTKGRSK